MASIFISHSSHDNEKAREVADWLIKNGWQDILLDLDPQRGIVAGQRWKEALQQAAHRCEVVLALVSPAWLSSGWCKSEVDAARLMGKRVMVALIGAEKSEIPPDLTDEQWLDLVRDPEGYQRLREGLKRAGLDPSTFVLAPGRRPYPGFAYFEEEDAAIFFGRDAQIIRAMDRMRSLVRIGVDRLLVILGASGSGKSSFLRAGLRPRLQRDNRAWLTERHLPKAIVPAISGIQLPRCVAVVCRAQREENAMGVKIRQKDGLWYVFINHQGQRKAKRIGSDKRVAVQVQKQLEAKLALGDVGLLKEEPKAVLFGEYAEQWLERYTPLTCKPSSRRVLRGRVVHHLIPAFGAQELRSITRNHVKTFVTTKLQHLSPGHVRNLMRTFHTICAQAVDDAVLDRNPASRLGKFLPEKRMDPEQGIDPFTSAELARYLATMQTHYPQYYPYFLTLARTGMREGEALGLRWEDMQFGTPPSDSHRFIHVQRTYDSAHHLMNTPKNGKTRRVDMAPDLRTCLLNWREHGFEKAVLAGRTTLFPLMFASATGQPWNASRSYRLHTRCCALAGLRATRIHDLRHSYATRMLYELHAPIQYVSEQLGHSSIKITVVIYGHPRQGMSTHLVDQLMQLSATLTQPEAISVP